MKNPSEGARCRPTATSVPSFSIVSVLESVPALLVRRVPRRVGELKTESPYTPHTQFWKFKNILMYSQIYYPAPFGSSPKGDLSAHPSVAWFVDGAGL